jgi:hypothetical protein
MEIRIQVMNIGMVSYQLREIPLQPVAQQLPNYKIQRSISLSQAKVPTSYPLRTNLI